MLKCPYFTMCHFSFQSEGNGHNYTNVIYADINLTVHIVYSNQHHLLICPHLSPWIFFTIFNPTPATPLLHPWFFSTVYTPLNIILFPDLGKFSTCCIESLMLPWVSYFNSFYHKTDNNFIPWPAPHKCYKSLNLTITVGWHMDTWTQPLTLRSLWQVITNWKMPTACIRE